MDEEFNTCGCLPKNLKRVIPNRETLVELLRHGIEERGVRRRWGVRVGCESNSMSLYLFFLFFFFFESYDYCLRYKILHAARAMA